MRAAKAQVSLRIGADLSVARQCVNYKNLTQIAFEILFQSQTSGLPRN